VVRNFILQKVFTKTFGKNQFPYKSVFVFFILVMIKDKLTDLCGNRLLQNGFTNISCEIRRVGLRWQVLRVRQNSVKLGRQCRRVVGSTRTRSSSRGCRGSTSSAWPSFLISSRRVFLENTISQWKLLHACNFRSRSWSIV